MFYSRNIKYYYVFIFLRNERISIVNSSKPPNNVILSKAKRKICLIGTSLIILAYTYPPMMTHNIVTKSVNV